MQCAVLPNGGRMLSYTYVTDIVRHADELEMLRNAFDNISEGVLLLDSDLKAQFLNRKTRDYWGVSPQQVAQHPSYAELIANAPHARAHDVPPEQREAFFASRVEAIRLADPPIRDAFTPDGRHHPRALLGDCEWRPHAHLLRRQRPGPECAIAGEARDHRLHDRPL